MSEIDDLKAEVERLRRLFYQAAYSDGLLARRLAHHRAPNEEAIMVALKELPGADIYPLVQPCDLLVGYQARTILLGIKHPEQSAYQTIWRARWPGQVDLIQTPGEAVATVVERTKR